MTGAPITGERVAVALVAACREAGLDPTQVFADGSGGGRARVMAAAACVARLGWSRGDAARVFRIHRTRLTPSGLEIARVTTDHLLSVVEALREHGLIPAAPAEPSPPLSAAVAAETPRRKPGGATDPARAGSGQSASAEATERVLGATPAARKSGAIFRPSVARGAATRVTTLKAVTPRIVRWTRQQLALGADLDFLAECFDVDVTALGQAVDAPLPREMAA